MLSVPHGSKCSQAPVLLPLPRQTLCWPGELKLLTLSIPKINAAQEPWMGQLEPSACEKAKHLSVHARYLALGLIIIKYKSRHYLATIYNGLHVQC